MDIESDIQDKALALGFDLCGIAAVRVLDADRDRFDNWLSSGYHSTLDYMCRNTDKRFDPSLLVPGARSVIVCAASYNRGIIHKSNTNNKHVSSISADTQHELSSPDNNPDIPVNSNAADNTVDLGPEYRPRIASYALRRDYHLTIKERLLELCAFIRQREPSFEGRAFVDTAPLLEKRWAVEAGLGWIGHNSLLVNPRFGSFMMLGEIVTTLDLRPTRAERSQDSSPYSATHSPNPASNNIRHNDLDRHKTEEPLAGRGSNEVNGHPQNSGRVYSCGSCRRCMEACPNGAIVSPMVIDTRRCISRITVESKYSKPETNTNTDTSATVPLSEPTITVASSQEASDNLSGDTLPNINNSLSAQSDSSIYGTYDHPGKQDISHNISTEPHAIVSEPSLHGWIFGCDECQLCCPYNIRAEISPNNLFGTQPQFTPPTTKEWLAMSKEEFRIRFKDTPLGRCGLDNIQRNLLEDHNF